MMYSNKLLVSARPKCEIGKSDKQHVVFVFVNNHRGAVGVVLNGGSFGSLTSLHLKDVFNTPEGNFTKTKEMILEKRFDEVPLYYGGPAKTEGIYFLHSYQRFSKVTRKDHDPAHFDIFDESVPDNEIFGGLYFGSPFTFAHIVESDVLDSSKFRFYTGQCKWNPAQLETEVAAGYWKMVDPEVEYFFDDRACEALLLEAQEGPLKHSLN